MLKKNDIVEARVTAYGSEGEGVCKIDGYTVFVPMAAVGDVLKIKILKAGKSYGYGKIEEIISPSADRVSPACPAYEKCGGCSIMHLSYPAQLAFKKQKVADALYRIGGIADAKVQDVFKMDEPFYYRNKIQLPVSASDDGVVTGFYAPRSHRVIPIGECKLQRKNVKEYISAVLEWMKLYSISPYSEENHSGCVRHIYIRTGLYTNEMMVSIVANTKKLPHADELCRMLLNIKSPFTLTSVIHNINTKKTNVVLGSECIVLYGRDFIYDTLEGLKFKISHNSFYQVNPKMTEQLYKKALELLGDVSDMTVFDLYCGIGTISLFAAREAKKVIGVEYVSEAIEDARENAKMNSIDNAEFYCGDAGEVVTALYKMGITADAVIVDPPRKGLGEDLFDTLSKMRPGKIVYVSCNAATLARDVKALCADGYEIKAVCPFDQFPNTAHVETVVLLNRA